MQCNGNFQENTGRYDNSIDHGTQCLDIQILKVDLDIFE